MRRKAFFFFFFFQYDFYLVLITSKHVLEIPEQKKLNKKQFTTRTFEIYNILYIDN